MYSDSFHLFKHLHKHLVCELGNAKPIQIPNTTSEYALISGPFHFLETV